MSTPTLLPSPTVVDVYLPRSAGRSWTYLAEPFTAVLRPGVVVAANFGRRPVAGVVVGHPRPTGPDDPPLEKLRRLQSVVAGNPIPDDLWQLLDWLSRYHLIPLPEVLDRCLATAHWRIETTEAGADLHFFARPRDRLLCVRPVPGAQPVFRSPAYQAAWDRLASAGVIAPEELSDILANPNATLRVWLKRGWLTVHESDPQPLESVALSAEQEQALAAIASALADDRRGGRHVFVLEGITGSGKTEVYAAAARRALAAGRTVLALTPEIALAEPLAERLRRRCGVPVIIWHSAIAAGEKGRGFSELLSNRARIVVGARSALFAPLHHLGLVIVDEEHDTAYAQAEGLSFNARDAAIQRARFAGATAVLGSATPSLETAYMAQSGRFTALHLRQRAHHAELPVVAIVDMADPRERGPYPWLSATLASHLASTLRSGRQAILFRNRRGFHPAVICTHCRESQRCRQCAQDLALHQHPAQLRCHVCGAADPWTQTCRQCGAVGHLHPVGAGTQRIVSELQALFPDARIERLDRDVVTSASRIASLLKDLEAGRIDILVGTQMVAKGHDAPGVTLVGIIQIDGALHLPDFRAPERVFQQVCQVSGRAGRRDERGTVVLQTLQPTNPVLQAAARHDVAAFRAAALAARRAAGYPPFGRLVRVVWRSTRPGSALSAARAAVKRAKLDVGRVFGPAPAPLERSHGYERVHAIALGADLNALRRWAAAAAAMTRNAEVSVQIDPTTIV